MTSERPDFELSAPAARNSVGEQLQAARVNQGLTIENVAKQLKLAPRQVSALEKDDIASLPPGPFLRGFVRNYARLVRLDADALLTQLGGAHVSVQAPVTAPPVRGELRETNEPRQIAKWLVPVALVSALLIGATWFEMRKSKPHVLEAAPVAAPAPPAAIPTTTAAPAPTNITAPGLAPALPTDASANGAQTSAAVVAAAPPTTAATPLAPVADKDKPVTLELAFAEASWTEIRDGAGNVLTSRMQTKGSTLTVAGQPPFRFTIGQAKSVTLKRDGSTIDLAARAGPGNVAKFTLE